jgi:hypothetical protein
MIVCPGCNRHVREETCPFCGAIVDRREKSARAAHHATRAALAFGTAATAVGVTLAACSSQGYTPPYDSHPLSDSGLGTIDDSSTGTMDAGGDPTAPGYGSAPTDSGVTGTDNDASDTADASGSDASDQ